MSNELIDNIKSFIIEKALSFGAKTDVEFNKSYVLRNNTGTEALKDNGAYFGFIHPDEEMSGPFHDFSLTIFPNIQNKPWLVCLGIGSSGFKNDYDLATFPGLRRLFSKLIDERGFCKTEFSDIETSLPKTILSTPDLQHIKNTIKTYKKVLPVCQIVNNPESEEGQRIISAFVAGYAKLRDWASNKEHRRAISDALNYFIESKEVDLNKEIKDLLKERKYIVLQGPPGTGKTRIAKNISESILAKTFFTQFHAETSFSDFIYGLRPDLNNQELRYTQKLGIFTEALKYAIENDAEQVILIIDEINRANLSNILGPIFYLFEHKMDKSNIEIEISPGFRIKQLPKNFSVIATMNTADRSLAVVDFALRRRFAWYDLIPTAIKGPARKLTINKVDNGETKEVKINVFELSNNQIFFIEDFTAIQEIFNWYASSNELSLQPGQGYFIAGTNDEMKHRIKFEILPLIKEYLQEGFIRNSAEEFNNYFSKRIKKSLSE